MPLGKISPSPEDPNALSEDEGLVAGSSVRGFTCEKSSNAGPRKLTVVGSGVVGQATGRGFMDHGYQVQFVDVNPEVISKLKEKGLDVYTPAELAEQDDSDVTVFTVSTPTEQGQINLDYLERAVIDFGRRLRKMDGYRVAVVRSTVLPGTTEGMVKSRIEEYSGKKAGEDFGLVMNPEYLREVSAEEDFKQPWVITIGEYDTKSGEVMAEIYDKYDCPKYRVSILEAEVQKYVHNIFNAAKISYFNEMRQVCEQLGVKADEIFPIVAKSCEGMWRAEYGTRNMGPYSGMCLPKDTQAFYAWAKSKGWDMPGLRATMEVNQALENCQQSEERLKQLAREPEAA